MAVDFDTFVALLMGAVNYEWCACGVRVVGEGLSRCVPCEADHANACRAAQSPTA